ncbi:MAG: transcription-repair coupling factor [Zetaproteobacteria bacterium]|nr:MAG: transcription-repair coupling factor [Zetaproteobacteria bacterium]
MNRGGSTTAAIAFRLAEIAARHPGRLIVHITDDVRSYRALSEALAFFIPQPERLWRFPAWEVLPYDRVSPHHAIVGERFATLSRLLRTPDPAGVLLTALPAWLQRIAPPTAVAAHVWQIRRGDTLDPVALRHQLTEAGMQPVDRVLDSGEFAVRGGIVDIWPPTARRPIRIELFGDEIDSLRHFDIDSQRSGEEIDAFTSVPVREVILDGPGRRRFCAAFRARFPHLRGHPMVTAAEAGRPHPGIESLLPLAYEGCARLCDYLPEEALVTSRSGNLTSARDRFAAQVRAQFELMRHAEEPAISPQELFATETAIETVALARLAGEEIAPPPSLARFAGRRAPLHALRGQLAGRLEDGWRLLLVAHGPGQRERMIEACAPLHRPIADCRGLHDLPEEPGSVACALGFLDEGMELPDRRLLLLTGRELLGQRIPRRRSTQASSIRANLFQRLQELTPGALVVHEDHGIGRYRGLETMEVEPGQPCDFLHIEYRGESSIFVPVEELDRLHRYVGDPDPPLSKPGGEQWKRTRERVKKDLLAIAHELIATEAARRTAPPRPIDVDEVREYYEEFCAAFPFEETEDQHQAIDAVLADLKAPTPMDRVICGDVGFGKTEVAMRAAFVAAACGRQVALLAPTTVLANQHYATLRERFAGTGITIALLSRLQGQADAGRIRAQLADGAIQIVVGTHRLLQSSIRFADLALLIIDEEHRFGVRQKERLKELHAGINLLTMSATPIPRTLHQTLSGLRDVSIIATPPGEREAIRTIVAPFRPELAAEAIRRELYRGGQVYYLHNHVKSIERVAERLRAQLPEAEIGVAHGRMGPAMLDRAMLAFYEGRLHILVCTTIIESGLDVTNANTIIVERADLLGLAQLHQIRGRVGRSHRQAFAYLFTPDPRAMTAEARERLQAIAAHSELGAGFMLARQDMEIRGAGNLLGVEQSGRIQAVGIDLYLEMLGEAIEEVRGAPSKPRTPACRIEHPFPAILPPDYIPQTGERLALYRRIGNIGEDEEADRLLDEISDRFGRPPTEVRLCLALARLRRHAGRLRIRRIDFSRRTATIHFTADSPIEPMLLLRRVQAEPRRFALTPDGALTIRMDEAQEAMAQIACCIDFLHPLLEHCNT